MSPNTDGGRGALRGRRSFESSGPGAHRVTVEWQWLGDEMRVTASWRGGKATGRAPRFEDALGAAVVQLPAAAVPVMCGACRLAFVDPFAGSSGFDDLSCYRDQPELAEEILRNGRGASAAAFDHMHKRPVTACDSCSRFSPRAATGPAGRRHAP